MWNRNTDRYLFSARTKQNQIESVGFVFCSNSYRFLKILYRTEPKVLVYFYSEPNRCPPLEPIIIDSSSTILGQQNFNQNYKVAIFASHNPQFLHFLSDSFICERYSHQNIELLLLNLNLLYVPDRVEMKNRKQW